MPTAVALIMSVALCVGLTTTVQIRFPSPVIVNDEPVEALPDEDECGRPRRARLHRIWIQLQAAEETLEARLETSPRMWVDVRALQQVDRHKDAVRYMARRCRNHDT